MNNITLRPTREHLKDVAKSFQTISFTHIYKELNRDALLKETQ
jgi:hypothetical protein